MKKAIILGLLVLFLPVAAAFAQVSYRISGQYSGGAGKWICLQQFAPGDIEGVTTDSVVIGSDGTFLLEGNVDEMQYAMLILEGTKAYRAVFLDGTPIEIKINELPAVGKKAPGHELNVLGDDPEQEAVVGMMQFFGDDYLRNFRLGMLELSLKRADNQAERDSVSGEIKKVNEERCAQLDKFVTTYGDCTVAAFFIEVNMLKTISSDEISSFYDRLSDRVKQTPKGQEMGERVALLKKLAPGSLAPEFELTTPDGKKLALKDLKGHIVLLDFWASWCGPCMDEMPNVKAIHEKYKDRGLEIVGVSMDNNRANWEGAIERAGLAWRHVSSLKGTKRCPVAKLYQVTAIPKLYIIGKDGRIIAKDLRGDDLRDKIDELFR